MIGKELQDVDTAELLELDPSKKDTIIAFVNAAQELIDEEGLKSVSIRKIALKAGFHNSTIYLYFRDLSQLTMLASMKYLQEYSQLLEEVSLKERSTSENFLAIWEFFFDSIMENPFVYRNFFFGKHSDNLKNTIYLYYQLFPEEQRTFSPNIEEMFYGDNINTRSMMILTPLLEEDNLLTEGNIDMINEIIVSYCRHKLELRCELNDFDITAHKNDFLNALIHIIGLKS